MEAATMDPQQRKLLEVVYECFESAGATLEELAGTQTGCYVGCFTSDWHSIMTRDCEYPKPYEMTVRRFITLQDITWLTDGRVADLQSSAIELTMYSISKAPGIFKT